VKSVSKEVEIDPVIDGVYRCVALAETTEVFGIAASACHHERADLILRWS